MPTAYDSSIRNQLISAIERIVRAECEASGAPKPPEIEVFDRFPLTVNDPGVTERVTAAFIEHFGEDRVKHLDPITASEDFSFVPDAFGTPYTYWGVGGFTAEQEIRPNHNPGFAPALQPTLRTGTEAALAAAHAFLRKEPRS